MSRVAAAAVDGWLSELGLAPVERAERDGIASWDLVLDSRRRGDVRVTLMLDPAMALVCWVHFAPPLGDSFRASYRRFLRWNDELPFLKFALAEDERPVLVSELPAATLERDVVGAAIARLLAVCDLLLPDSVSWLWPGARAAPAMDRPSRNEALFVRYEEELRELLEATADAEGRRA